MESEVWHRGQSFCIAFLLRLCILIKAGGLYAFHTHTHTKTIWHNNIITTFIKLIKMQSIKLLLLLLLTIRSLLVCICMFFSFVSLIKCFLLIRNVNNHFFDLKKTSDVTSWPISTNLLPAVVSVWHFLCHQQMAWAIKTHTSRSGKAGVSFF